MKIDVFDTYAHTVSSSVLHFDVLLPNGASKEHALQYAQSFLASIGLEDTRIATVRCDFCHSQAATLPISEAIKKDGYFILQMEGCPNPY